jgi:hypothetical protein
MKAEKANKLISKGLLNLGANPLQHPFFTMFSIMTKYGELQVTLSKPECRSQILSCYSKFKDVSTAKNYVDCNPYSGKWNWTVWSKDHTAESFAELVLSKIRSILAGNLNIPPKQWLKEYFEYQNCDECHRGARSHTAIPFNGNWFARCNDVKKRK